MVERSGIVVVKNGVIVKKSGRGSNIKNKLVKRTYLKIITNNTFCLDTDPEIPIHPFFFVFFLFLVIFVFVSGDILNFLHLHLQLHSLIFFHDITPVFLYFFYRLITRLKSISQRSYTFDADILDEN